MIQIALENLYRAVVADDGSTGKKLPNKATREEGTGRLRRGMLQVKRTPTHSSACTVMVQSASTGGGRGSWQRGEATVMMDDASPGWAGWRVLCVAMSIVCVLGWVIISQGHENNLGTARLLEPFVSTCPEVKRFDKSGLVREISRCRRRFWFGKYD